MAAKNQTFKLRISELDKQRLKERADAAGVSSSAFLINAISENPIVIPGDPKAAYELRRAGALMKSRYPSLAKWTMEEKRQYWAALNELLSIARKIEGNKDVGESD